MIRKIGLEHFKCFKDLTTFECGPINVFMGANGLGKSSVFQSILLISQSVLKNKDIDPLLVNGQYVCLDKFNDLLYTDGPKSIFRDFSINIDYEAKEAVRSLCLTYSKKSSREGSLSDINVNGESKFGAIQGLGKQVGQRKNGKAAVYKKEEIVRLFNQTTYISASRLGPTRREAIDDPYASNRTGKDGEHRLNVLINLGKLYRLPIDNDKHSLKDTVNYWMNEILNGFTINVHGIEDDQADVLSLRIIRPDGKTGYKAINSGFGYSYVLSVIEAILLSTTTCPVFIENPEAHLHPAAQSRLAKLIIWAAKSGRQIFIETHSEHVLDGLRVWVTKDDALKQTDLCIHYFNMDGTTTQMHMDKFGFLEEEAPKGFCDQATVNGLELFKLKFREEQLNEH